MYISTETKFLKFTKNQGNSRNINFHILCYVCVNREVREKLNRASFEQFYVLLWDDFFQYFYFFLSMYISFIYSSFKKRKKQNEKKNTRKQQEVVYEIATFLRHIILKISHENNNYSC